MAGKEVFGLILRELKLVATSCYNLVYLEAENPV